MQKKILLLSLIIIMFIPFCNDAGLNKINNDLTTDNTINDPTADEPVPVIQLDSLKISEGTLIPEFSPDIFYYDILLDADVAELITSMSPSAGCTAEIDNIQIPTDDCSTTISISKPVTDISISVNNKNGEGALYSLTITRMMEKPVSNPSFEIFDEKNHPAGWEMSGSGELKSTGEIFYSGNYCGSFTTLTGSLTGREALSSPIEVETGKSITTSAWFYIDYIETLSSERINMSLKLYYFTDAACTLPASTTYSTMPKTFLKRQGAWENIYYKRKPAQLPADVRFIRIGVRACYDKEKSGTKNDRVFFDDISLQQ